MTVLIRLLFAASLCLAPLAAAVAQDQHDDQHRRRQQQEHPQPQQQHKQQQHTERPQQPSARSTAHMDGETRGGPQSQHRAHNNAPPRPPPGATAAPRPPSQAHGQGATRRNPSATQTPRSTASFAARHGGAQPAQFDHGHFYGRDYAHFTPRDRDLWHRGTWHHERRGGRYGWWYAVDGIWYFFAAPIYPYPTFVPDVVYIPEEDYEAPPAYYFYFCPDTQSYYPYVSSCASPWQPVPAIPPQPQ